MSSEDNEFDEFEVESHETEQDIDADPDEATDGGPEADSGRDRLDEANEDLDTYSHSDTRGHVIVSRDLRISRYENDIFVYVHNEHRDDVRLGDYVQLPYPLGVRDGHAELFGVVEELQYGARSDPGDRRDFVGGMDEESGTIDERSYELLARINPITTIEGDREDLEAGQVDRIPKPSTYMYPSDDEYCLRAGLNIPEEGPFVGYMSVSGETRPRDNPLPFKLPDDDGGEPAIFRHGVVGGSTGKGKTHFMKNLLRQYATQDRTYTIEINDDAAGTMGDDDTADRQLATLIIDPENEYSELGEDNPDYDYDEPLEKLDGKSINDLKKEGIEVGGINDSSDPTTDLRTYIPDVQHTSTPPVGESHDFSIPFTIVEGRPQLMIPFEVEGPTRDALEKSLQAFFQRAEPEDDDKYDGKYAEYRKFVQHGRDWLESEDPYEDGIPAEGKWAADLSLNENTLNAVWRRIDKSSYKYVFDNGSPPITEMTNEVFKPGRTTVIPTSHLTGRKEKLVVMCLLALVVDNKLSDYDPDYNIKDTPLLLVLDEAHNYISEPATVQEEYVVGRYRLAARQGRKYKLGLFNVTQNPADIDPEITKQTNTSIYLGLEPEVIEEINIPGTYENALTNFGKGQAVVKAPDVRAVEVMGLSVCLTKHSK